MLKAEKSATDGSTVVEPYRYDQEASLRKFYLAIIMHEYPFSIVEHTCFVEFIRSLHPSFPIRSRPFVKKEMTAIYEQERSKLYEYFQTINCCFSTTMDMWTSNQNKAYMCITVHWIDDNWGIQKRIINFMHLKGRHTGANLADAFTASCMKWFIDKKIFSLSLDNASANEVCVKDVIEQLNKDGHLICDGLFFHVRCANHILNLVARDGLQQIASSGSKIRLFVGAVKSSPLQMELFLKCAAQSGLKTTVGLGLDVTTRWNSTYLMLRDALYYRKAFGRLYIVEKKRYEDIVPSDAEWDKALTLCRCLKKFKECTDLFSGNLYPTANLFYQNFCDIKILISEWCGSKDATINIMGHTMSTKFEKYWKKSNTALAVACFLDPRFKKGMIEFYMKKFYGELLYQPKLEDFMTVVKQLYSAYATSNRESTTAPSSVVTPEEPEVDDFMEDDSNELQSFLYDNNGADSGGTNDLEKYLAESILRLTKTFFDEFDILAWWKIHEEVYPVLSKLARDVLAMQVSTVASESAFSAGGRVIDPFRSRLEPETVEQLICTKDWVAASRKEKKLHSIVNDLEVVEALVANLTIEDEEIATDDED